MVLLCLYTYLRMSGLLMRPRCPVGSGAGHQGFWTAQGATWRHHSGPEAFCCCSAVSVHSCSRTCLHTLPTWGTGGVGLPVQPSAHASSSDSSQRRGERNMSATSTCNIIPVYRLCHCCASAETDVNLIKLINNALWYLSDQINNPDVNLMWIKSVPLIWAVRTG